MRPVRVTRCIAVLAWLQRAAYMPPLRITRKIVIAIKLRAGLAPPLPRDGFCCHTIPRWFGISDRFVGNGLDRSVRLCQWYDIARERAPFGAILCAARSQRCGWVKTHPYITTRKRAFSVGWFLLSRSLQFVPCAGGQNVLYLHCRPTGRSGKYSLPIYHPEGKRYAEIQR